MIPFNVKVTNNIFPFPYLTLTLFVTCIDFYCYSVEGVTFPVSALG